MFLHAITRVTIKIHCINNYNLPSGSTHNVTDRDLAYHTVTLNAPFLKNLEITHG